MARLTAAAALTTAALFALAGCIHTEHHHRGVAVHSQTARKGPPPHAPAHGYRHKNHRGVELVYDTGLGVYAVVGWNATYYHGADYLRYHGGAWQRADRLRGPWRAVAPGAVPPRLVGAHGARAAHPSKGNRGRGHGAAKPAW